MHAYASDDPVFVAMNNRGQRETGGRLGDFCVKCHAPLAVELGFTDGTNFDPAQPPPHVRGVTCYFCHNVAKVTSTHNNGLVIGVDQTMRGGLRNPADNPAHRSKYDPLMDSDINESEICGSCHDIVVPASINGRADIGIKGPTPLAGPPAPGGICVTPESGGQITVRVDSFGTGHAWPSGAAQDRRARLELIAYDAANNVIFQSGVVPDGMDPETIGDPNLFGFWDRTFKSDDTPAHFFWEVARIDSQLLRPPVTLDKFDPAFDHSTTKIFPIAGRANDVERITTRFRFRALPYALLDDLIASGDLDPSIRARLPTLTVGATVKTWEKATRIPATGCSPQ